LWHAGRAEPGDASSTSALEALERQLGMTQKWRKSQTARLGQITSLFVLVKKRRKTMGKW